LIYAGFVSLSAKIHIQGSR